ncbi:hypothetical protein P153DRAFT_398434 [Dothidotthia symphoricarpi CBS 119687]|uniref:Zinc knuckle domain-containing protein n=1 Tax=Dothidotthia symphoricarpi CBS 119687 TaxID=1392245 RepID=A0A6A6A5H8_9PLEO|nr:uncharacterized protein P153DRAFT_398434 [Dothidotthia symphoricarpi CBS 119687]KAF2127060.1 hypothetical protein P153DRAFT_398434 [Dothidotthia symphoricarpi CBS 119687]
MFRKPGTGRSKASADTLCQKCLKRGHYSYECKATTQERPYVSRPSRTQQLLNPKLKPKLTTEVPNELLRKKGVADDILKQKEDARGRDRKSRKRSRSRSSSADSISTISTNRSPSRSPAPRRRKHHVPPKRTQRPASVDSRDQDRNTRRRMSSFSPDERGRRRTRSRSRSRSSRVHNKARSASSGADESRSRSRKAPGKRPVRVSTSRSRSPEHMDTSDGRNGAVRGRWGASPPPKKSPQPVRGGRSPSPYSRRRAPSPQRGRMGGDHRGGRNRFDDGPGERVGRNAPPPAQPPPVQRERSLSPFSKRVALTKAMNTGQM